MAEEGRLWVTLGISISKFLRDLTKVQNDLRSFGRNMQSVGSSLTQALTVPLVAVGLSALKSSGQFESAMLRVESKLGLTGAASEEAKKKLEELALKLGADTVFSAGEAAAAMEALVAQGFNVEQVISALPAVLNLASTENMGLADAASIVSAALKGYGFEAASAAAVVDVLAKASINSASSAQSLGDGLKTVGPVAAGFKLDFTEMVSILAVMADAGIEGGRAGTALASAIGSLAKPVGEGANAIEAMNLQVFESPGVMRPMKDILADIAKTADPTTTALQIFGKTSGPEMIAAMNQGIPKIREFENGLRDAGGTAERVGKAQMSGFQGALEALKGSWETLGIVMGKSGFLQWVTDAIRKVTEWVNMLASARPEMLAPWIELAAFLALTGPVMYGIGVIASAFGTGGILMKALKSLQLGFQLTWKAIVLIFTPAGLYIGPILIAALLIIAYWDDVKAAAKQLKKDLEIFFGVTAKEAQATAFMIDFFAGVVREKFAESGRATDELGGVHARVMGKLRDETGKTEESQRSLATTFKDKMGAALKTVQETGAGMVEALSKGADGMNTALVVRGLPKLTDGAKAWFTDFVSLVQQRTGDVVTKFTAGIAPLSTKMGEELEETKTRWKTKFDELLVGVQHSGKQVFEDFTGPIENIIDAVTGFAAGAMDGFRTEVNKAKDGPVMAAWKGFWTDVMGHLRTVTDQLSTDLARAIITGDDSLVGVFKNAAKELAIHVLDTIINAVLMKLIEQIDKLIRLLPGMGPGGQSKASMSGNGITDGIVGLGKEAGVGATGMAFAVLRELLGWAFRLGGKYLDLAQTVIGTLFGGQGPHGRPGSLSPFLGDPGHWLHGPELLQWFLQHGLPDIPGFINNPWNPGGFIPPGPGGKPGGGGSPPPPGPGGDLGVPGGVFGSMLAGAGGYGTTVNVYVGGSVMTRRGMIEDIRDGLKELRDRTGPLGFED